MRLGREKKPAIQPDHAEFSAEVAIALRDALERHRALPADPETLLEPARRAAALGRALTWMAEDLAGGLADAPQLFSAMRVLRRAAYSLAAHAQSPPDPTGALSADALEALLDAEVREWQERWLRADAEVGAR
jgi:hypothetical protein